MARWRASARSLQGGAGVGHLLLAAGAAWPAIQGIVHGLGAAFAIADGCARLAQPLLQLVDLGTMDSRR
jgi:hypothetical protein